MAFFISNLPFPSFALPKLYAQHAVSPMKGAYME